MALDGAGTAMTISNESNVLIYMNDAARRLWTEMALAIRQMGCCFSLETMIRFTG